MFECKIHPPGGESEIKIKIPPDCRSGICAELAPGLDSSPTEMISEMMLDLPFSILKKNNLDV